MNIVMKLIDPFLIMVNGFEEWVVFPAYVYIYDYRTMVAGRC